jgi:radical SAM protein with 4Fe4S-binding SPASM domain
MCPQWGEQGYNLDKDGTGINADEATAEDYARLASEVAAWRPHIYIWGGEPLLYPEIRPVLEEFKARGLSVSLGTNGTTLGGHAGWLVEAGLDLLMVSLDGPADIHDSVRGREGAFERQMQGLAAVREAQASRKESLPHLLPLITVNRENPHALLETLEVCEAEGADFVGIYFSWFTNEAIGRAYEACFECHFGETPTSWQGYCDVAEGIDVEALLSSLRAIKKHRWSFPYFLVPNLRSEDDIREFYRNPANTFGYKRCFAPYYMVLVLPNGDVATCRDYPDYVVGNIRKSSLAEIFNNERFQRFRRALKEDGLFPICSRCCGLMGY